MPDGKPKYRFALTGNGPVSNRGCQAILNGTHKILEREFGPCRFLVASFGADPPSQLPPGSEPLELSFERPRWSRAWWEYQVRRGLGLRQPRNDVTRALGPRLAGCGALFSVGGDNYAISCGYEIVERLMAMDCQAKAGGIPVIIWGASVGPFDRDRPFEQRMARHLSQVDLIVVREPVSQKYLKSLGIEENVVLAPDPSFAVDPRQPRLSPDLEEFLDGGFIGLNLSPLLAQYTTGGDLDRWRTLAAEWVAELLREMECPILLIPHVTSPAKDPRMDDSLFLTSLLPRLKPKGRPRVAVAPGELSCEELKGLISRAEVFIGARTHSTLAAFSTGVPCISIAYSRKAWGVNEWIYGNNDWIMDCQEVAPGGLAARVARMRREKDRLRPLLQQTALRMKQEAHEAARPVAKILGS